MNVFAIMALINVITSLVLGLLIFFSNTKKGSNRLFILFALAVSLWSLSYFFWQIAVNASDALFWSHILMLGATMIPFFYFHFITLLLNEYKRHQIAVWVGYMLMAFFLIINETPLFITGISAKGDFAFWPDPGPLFSLFLCIWIFYAGYVAWLLWCKRSVGNEAEQHQISLILIGTILGYVGGCTNFFLWFGINVPPYGNISAAVYVGIVAYAIMRYQLFNMKVVAAQMLTFVLWLSLFTRILVATSAQEQLFNVLIFIFTLGVGVFLIRSVDKEVKQREKLELLSKDLEKANTHLTELDRQKSEFIGIAAHQLRTPIAAIKGYSSLILEGSYGKTTKSLHDVTKTIFDSSARMADTIADFLNVSRIEQGKMEYHKEPMDLAQAVEDTVATFGLAAKEKKLVLTYTADECRKEDHVIEADPGKIQHVINNLIDNAIKYTLEGTIEVHLSCNKEKRTIRVEVKDTGAGIPPDIIGELFVKFVRARNAKNINVTGSGLGLYVARQMIEAHGGKIWAESEGEGKGSTFIFELPLAAK